ncbi:hypothetical protein K3727_19725 [Rhodobacteraceae bacterium M382]|nr:hypothetical protein K3727_19725 [Rhodobacteraceae bacterium M382]
MGSPIVLASVPKDSGYLRGDFVVGSTGDVSIQYSVVTGTSYFHSHKVPAGDRVETELRHVRLTEDGALDGTQSLASWSGYIPELRLTALNDGGLALVYSGEPKDWIAPASPGGYTAASIPDPDSLLQRFDADGNPVGSPSVWTNPGAAVLDRDIGLGRGGVEVSEVLSIFERPDGTALVIVAEPFGAESRSYGLEPPAHIYSYILQADGTLGARQTLFDNPLSDPNPSSVWDQDGEIQQWQIVTLGDGTSAFLSVRGFVVGETPDGSLDYHASIMMQGIDANGALTGEARELVRFDASYASFVQLLDVELNADGALVLVTSSVRSGFDKHIVPDDGTEVVSINLVDKAEDPLAGLFYERTAIAEIRPDGGVVLLRGGQLADTGGPQEDVIYLSTYAADGQSEGPGIRLGDKRNIDWRELNVTADGLITAVWDNAGEPGDPYVGRLIDGAAFHVLSPRILTDDADLETLDSPGFVDGAAGDDTLTGSDGDDRLIGGTGNDMLSGGLGHDLFLAGAGDDTIHGSDGTDVAFWAGNWEDYTAVLVAETEVPEHLRDMGPVYAITGRNSRTGDGQDLILGIEELVFDNRRMTLDELVTETLRETGAFDDVIEGVPGENETLDGGIGNDTLRGLDGDDSLVGGEDIDLLEGGSGDDTLVGGDGVDVLDGGEGTDTAVFSGNWRDYDFALTGIPERFSSIPEIPMSLEREGQAIVVTARDDALGDDQTDFLYNIEDLVFADRSDSAYQILLEAGTFNLYLNGTPGADTITGGIGNDQIDGDAGNDLIFGGPGNDYLNGSFSDDSIEGGRGNDTLEGDFGNDTLDGGPGDDELQSGGGEGDVLRGGDGNDSLNGWYGPTTQEGGAGDDRLWGGNADDVLYGQSGVDTIDGNEGNDFADGGDGDDYVRGQEGSDYLFGRAGNDTINGGQGSDTINGGVGDDLIIGGSDMAEFDLADMILAGDGDDHVLAGAGNDHVFGQDGNDRILGGLGADTLVGQQGNDTLSGGALSDQVFGGDGDDYLNGGFGHDRLNGGSGADRFFHVGVPGHGSDWIQDYSSDDGDILLWGGGAAARGDFQVNFAHTANGVGERAGEDLQQEAFVIYRPTGQIIWALVDGQGQDEINLRIAGETFDLLV